MAKRGDETTDESKPALKQEGVPAGVNPAQRALDVRLQKLSRSTLDRRRRATVAAFDLADECATLAETMSKKELVAFLQQECELSRAAALAILKLPAIFGAHRDLLEERAVGDAMLLRLVREPEAVRSEIIAMLRAGRDMSDIDLRALRRDVLAGQEVISAVHASPALGNLKRAVRARAKHEVGGAVAWVIPGVIADELLRHRLVVKLGVTYALTLLGRQFIGERLAVSNQARRKCNARSIQPGECPRMLAHCADSHLPCLSGELPARRLQSRHIGEAGDAAQ